MSTLIVIIGFKRAPDQAPVAENLYTGYDGGKAHAIAEEAADTGEYSKIGRAVSPILSPMRIEPHAPEFLKQQQKASEKLEKTAAQKAADAKAEEEAKENAKRQQAAADALFKDKQIQNQAKADEAVAGRRFLKRSAKNPEPPKEPAATESADAPASPS